MYRVLFWLVLVMLPCLARPAAVAPGTYHRFEGTSVPTIQFDPKMPVIYGRKRTLEVPVYRQLTPRRAGEPSVLVLEPDPNEGKNPPYCLLLYRPSTIPGTAYMQFSVSDSNLELTLQRARKLQKSWRSRRPIDQLYVSQTVWDHWSELPTFPTDDIVQFRSFTRSLIDYLLTLPDPEDPLNVVAFLARQGFNPAASLKAIDEHEGFANDPELVKILEAGTHRFRRKLRK